ncbi:O-acetyl-ADP-ribose deacetylase [compost metagenome]
MEITPNGSVIEVLLGNITTMETDAIVNAANTSLMGGGGVDGAIHRAGGKAILEDCIRIRNQQGGCPVGEAVITTGGNLKCRFVIHTVGPVWNGGTRGEEEKLKSCYRNSLVLADANHVASIAFPSISTGIYRYPKDLACQAAMDEVSKFLTTRETNIRRVVFVCFDKESLELYQQVLHT